jgi:hypothetical protein
LLRVDDLPERDHLERLKFAQPLRSLLDGHPPRLDREDCHRVEGLQRRKLPHVRVSSEDGQRVDLRRVQVAHIVLPLPRAPASSDVSGAPGRGFINSRCAVMIPDTPRLSQTHTLR